MERELYKQLNLDLKIGKLNKNFKLSQHFELLHNSFIKLQNSKYYFNLTDNNSLIRKDQLLLNLQYNNIIYHSYGYAFDECLGFVEEFFTYFLNYELTTGRWSPNFTENIQQVFFILNKYFN